MQDNNDNRSHNNNRGRSQGNSWGNRQDNNQNRSQGNRRDGGQNRFQGNGQNRSQGNSWGNRQDNGQNRSQGNSWGNRQDNGQNRSQGNSWGNRRDGGQNRSQGNRRDDGPNRSRNNDWSNKDENEFEPKLVLDQMVDSDPISFPTLARLCNIPVNKNGEFSHLLMKMVWDNQIGKTQDAEYFKLIFVSTGEGKFKSNPRGFGFVDLENKNAKDSIFFSPITRKNAIDGDVVQYKVFVDPVRKREVGIVMKIVSRNNKIVGIIKENGYYLDLFPLNTNIGTKIKIVNKRMAIKDHLVLAEVSRMERGYLVVKITKDLGHKDDENVDIDGLIISSGVNYQFSKKVLEETDLIPEVVLEKEIIGRQDLRNLYTITIDGADSKDFDDAISIEKKDKNYILYVHIADVSHYVSRGSAIDKEALARGTSIYVPGRVIPMLPQKLSNNICSLMPEVDRLTITCKMEVNSDAEVVKTEIFSSIINSDKRMIYHDVNEFLKKKTTIDNSKLSALLLTAHELSDILGIASRKKGYIDFEIEEAKIVLDSKGKADAIKIVKQDISEKIIENFMVLANEQVAMSVQDMGVPFIYRTHDKPVDENIVNLKKVVKSLGIKVDIVARPNSKKFAEFVNTIKEQRFDNFIKIMLLRTMSKAAYTTTNIGHFGLALKSYTHFTSPIRRYPDLMVHRMLRNYIFPKKANQEMKLEFSLGKIAAANSNSEIIAKNLERKIVDFKKAEYYERFVGTTKKGRIVSINKFGMFVEFDDKVDGLVKIESLQGFWKISDDGLELSSKTRIYSIGEEVTTKIVSVDKFDQKIDLVILDNHY